LTTKQWKRCFSDTLIGVEAELDPTAPSSARTILHGFHHRMNKAHTQELRALFEKDLDAFLESEEYLKVAAGRYIVKKMVPALDKATTTMRKAKALLAKYKKQPPE
jgi:hypothetical protein